MHQPVETNIELSPKSYPADRGFPAWGRRKADVFEFSDDPVFLTTMGLKAIGKLSIASERSIEHRSSLVDGRLVNGLAAKRPALCLAGVFDLPGRRADGTWRQPADPCAGRRGAYRV